MNILQECNAVFADDTMQAKGVYDHVKKSVLVRQIEDVPNLEIRSQILFLSLLLYPGNRRWRDVDSIGLKALL